MKLIEACELQVWAHTATEETAEDYINNLTNYELIEFLSKVQLNYGKELE